MTETELQAIEDKAKQLGEECYRLPQLRLVAEVRRCHIVLGDLGDEPNVLSGYSACVCERNEAMAEVTRLRDVDSELHQSRAAWVEQHKHLRAKLATAESERDEARRLQLEVVQMATSVAAERDQLRARVAELEAAGQRAANMAATATTSAVGNACIVRRMTEEAEQQRAKLATAVGALERIGSYDLRSEEDATYRHVMDARAALAKIRGGA